MTPDAAATGKARSPTVVWHKNCNKFTKYYRFVCLF